MIRRALILALVVVLAAVAAGLVLARPDELGLVRSVLSGGASEADDGNVALRATLGQPLVGMVASDDGGVTLGQGFWHSGIPNYAIYLPLVLR